MALSDEPVYGTVNVDPWGQKRIGDWIQTYSGRKFHLLDPKPEDFCIEDIAHALSNQCRFTGHVRKFYSVAEHSVRATQYLMGRFGGFGCTSWYYACLMHDATEAYMCDLARPFKRLPEFAFYRELEDKLMRKIAEAFGVAFPFHRFVKEADEIMLGTEARDLIGKPIEGWHFRYKHLPKKIRPWSPRKAEREFLRLFYSLNPRGIRPPSTFWGCFYR